MSIVPAVCTVGNLVKVRDRLSASADVITNPYGLN